MSEQEAQVTFLSQSLVTLGGEASSSAKGEGPLPITLGPRVVLQGLGIHPQRFGMPCASRAVLCCLDHLSFKFKGLLIILFLSVSAHLPVEAIRAWVL